MTAAELRELPVLPGPRTCETFGCGRVIEAAAGFLDQCHQDFFLDAAVYACGCGWVRTEPLKEPRGAL